MAETWILDPSAVAQARSQLDISAFIKSDGVDPGDAQIQAYMAEQGSVGSTVVDSRVPNRIIKIPLSLRAVGSTTFATIRTNLQQKVALMQREGGWVGRTIGATTIYADVVNASLHLGGSWLQAYRSVDIEATLELECIPDFYGDEVALSNHVTTTAAELTFTESSITGNHPGRMRLVVTGEPTADQHGLLWGLRSRHYGTASTEALPYEAESLQLLDAGTKVASAGASGGTVVRHPNLPAAAWCPVMATNIGGTAFMTHKGSYRVWARCYSGTATPQLRFLWDVGDMTSPITNDTVQIPTAGRFYLMDLGEVRLDPAPIAPHRWQGVIQAKATLQGDQIDIDKMWFQPLDESAGKLIAVQHSTTLGINVVQLAGAGADDSSVGSKAWTDTGNITAEDGAYALAGAGITGTSHYLKATSFGFAVPTGATIAGIKAEIKKGYKTGGAGSVVDNRVQLIKAGTIQTPNKADTVTPWVNSSFGGAFAWSAYGGQSDLWSGTWTAGDINSSGFGIAISTTDVGAGASIDVIRITVYYTTSGGFTSTADAVIFASRSAELRTEGMYRYDAGGTALGPISKVIGDLPRVPPSGLEGRPVEVFLKSSRGDLSTEPDDGVSDDLSARIFFRPSFLFTG